MTEILHQFDFSSRLVVITEDSMIFPDFLDSFHFVSSTCHILCTLLHVMVLINLYC